MRDWLTQFVAAKEFSSQVAVITLDEPAALSVSGSAWSYQSVAKLLDKLSSTSIKSVGVLLPLSHSENYFEKITAEDLLQTLKPPQYETTRTFLQQLNYDERLAHALKANGKVVLPVVYRRDSEAMENPLAELPAQGNLQVLAMDQSAKREWFTQLPGIFSSPQRPLEITAVPAGRFSNEAKSLGLLPQYGGGHRDAREEFAVNMGDHYFPTFITQMVSQILGTSLKLVPGYGVRLNGLELQTDADFRVLPLPSINSSRHLKVPVIPAADILNDASRGKTLKGIKAVVIGSSGAGQFTVYGNVPAAPAVWVAHVVNALTKGEVLQQPYWAMGLQRLMVILLAVYLMLLPKKLRGWVGFAITGLLAVIIINVSVLTIAVLTIFQPLVVPALFVLAGHFLLSIHFKISITFKSLHLEAANAYRELGLNLQSQGKLDQAFNYMRKCEMDNKLIECLYNLGLEFERRRQFNQAVAVYDYIANKDAEYRDIQERRKRHQSQSNRDLLTTSLNFHTATLVVDHPNVAQPVLGRYQIEKIIGQGAMGTVYLGVDPKISRTVAIKTLSLSDEFDSKQIEEVRRRFFREAETAGRLNHPNIVTIFDVGEEHDLAYIAMDFINGEGLDNFGHPDALLPIDDVFHIGITAADALAYAHQQNVVHRDIKPGNIIYDPQTKNLKITDFGIACLTDNTRTKTGTVLGSPSYMSPEQLAGEQVDGRSDIYSLGITLYQLFTGVLPFTADSMASLAYKIAHHKPPGVRKIRPELPQCLTRVINKAIEKDPQARYQNGTAFAEALRRCGNR